MGRKPHADIRLVRIPELTGSGLTRFTKAQNPVSRHAHDSLVLGTVDSGVRNITVADAAIHAGPGAVFVIPPGTVHSVSHPEGPCTGFALHCHPADLNELLGEVPPMATLAVQDHLLRSRLKDVAEAVEKELPALEQHGRLAEALARLQDRHGETTALPERRPHSGAEKAKALMVERFAEPLRLTELAEAAGMNPCALGRAFSASMGMPPHEFLTFVRVRNARRLLDSGAGVADTAVACGFSDQSHMHRAFKAVLGMTPGQYAEACAET